MTAESPPRSFAPTSALLLVGVQLCAAVGVLLLGGALSEGETVGPLFLIAAPIVAPLVAIYVGLVRYAPAEPTAAALRLERPAPGVARSIALALLFGLLASPLLVALEAQLMKLIPDEAMSPELVAELRAAVERPATLLFFSFGQVLLAPLCDEALFRGLIQPRLAARVGDRRAVWITLVFYAAAQLNPRVLPLAVVVGLPLGVIALATRSTWASFAAHLGMTGAPYVAAAVGLPFVDLESGATALSAPTLAVCAGLAAAALALVWRLRSR